MIVEFQQPTDRLLALFRYQLRQMLSYVALGPLPAAAPTDTIWLDTIDAPEGIKLTTVPAPIAIKTLDGVGLMSTIQGRQLWIDQPLTIVFARLSGATLTKFAGLACHFKVELHVWSSPSNITIRFDHANLELPEGVSAELQGPAASLKSFLDGWFQLGISLPVAAITLTPSDQPLPVVANAGVGVAGEFVTVRVEAGGTPPNAAAWQQFYNGQIPLRALTVGQHGFQGSVASAAWSHFVERGFVETAVRSMAEQGLKKSSEFHLDSPISTGWSTPNGAGHVDVNFTFRKPDACPCFGFDVDLVGDFHLGVTFTVPEMNRIQLDGHYGYDITSEAAETCCEVTLALVWPFLGDSDLDKLKMTRLEWFTGLMQGPIIIAMGLDARWGNQQLPPGSFGADCTTDNLPAGDFRCSKAFALGGATQLLRLNDLAGLPDGLLLLGDQILLLQRDRPGLHADVGTFAWTFQRASCNNIGPSALAARLSVPMAFQFGSTTVMLTQAPSSGVPPYDLVVHDAHVINDAAKQYAVGKLTGSPGAAYELVMHCGTGATAPCTVLIQSNAGLAIVTIPPPPPFPLTEDQAREMLKQDFFAAVSSCMAISDPFAAIKIKTVWLVDPPPDALVTRQRHLWGLAVQNTQRGYEVEITDVNDRPLATALAATRGVVELGFLNTERALNLSVTRMPGGMPVRSGGGVSPFGAAASHSDQHDAANGNGDKETHNHAKEPSRKFAASQTSLVHTADIGSSREAFQVAFVGHRATVAVASRDVVSFYDLRAPWAPALLREHKVPGLAGIAAGGGSVLLAWGKAGVIQIAVDRDDEVAVSRAGRSVVWTGRQWAVLEDGRVSFYDASFAPQCGMAAPAAGCALTLTAIGQRLLACDAHGPVAVAAEGATAWTPITYRDETLDWTRSSRAEQGGKTALFVPSRERGGTIVDIAGSSAIVPIVRYHADPWFWRSARRRDLRVLLDRQGQVSVWHTRATHPGPRPFDRPDAGAGHGHDDKARGH